MYSRVALLKRPRPLVPWSSWILKPQTKHEEEEVQREECNEEHSARNTSQVVELVTRQTCRSLLLLPLVVLLCAHVLRVLLNGLDHTAHIQMG